MVRAHCIMISRYISSFWSTSVLIACDLLRISMYLYSHTPVTSVVALKPQDINLRYPLSFSMTIYF